MDTQELDRKVWDGWIALGVLIITGIILGNWLAYLVQSRSGPNMGLLWMGALLVWVVCLFGFFTLQPNMSAVLTLFGRYKGTTRREGFSWANPLFKKKKLSLRAHNLNSERIKVNDVEGNPIEIAAVVVWRVTDTATASFDVVDYREYVEIQTDAALRNLAMAYPYDSSDEAVLSLRGDIENVTEKLQLHVQERVAKAGVVVDEARIAHLAYAPEIAGAMLQRQQAGAVVAARTRIVDGAVGMVEMALAQLSAKDIVHLDDERKAAMVSNLMVVLCSDKAAQPIVNTGSLYS
jgi:regulator of protease activity HflC (stomatin/prohibitin superfamily)